MAFYQVDPEVTPREVGMDDMESVCQVSKQQEKNHNARPGLISP
jgi:hypothetical protein